MDYGFNDIQIEQAKSDNARARLKAYAEKIKEKREKEEKAHGKQ